MRTRLQAQAPRPKGAPSRRTTSRSSTTHTTAVILRAEAIRRVCAMMHNLTSRNESALLHASRTVINALHQSAVRARLVRRSGRDDVNIRFSNRFVKVDAVCGKEETTVRLQASFGQAAAAKGRQAARRYTTTDASSPDGVTVIEDCPSGSPSLRAISCASSGCDVPVCRQVRGQHGCRRIQPYSQGN